MKGEKKYVIHRGFAMHADQCPIDERVWKGKSYANVFDDCLYCKHCLAISDNLGDYTNPGQFIVCGGKEGIEREDTGQVSKRIPVDLEEDILIPLRRQMKPGEFICECQNCGYIKTDNKLTGECSVCDTKDDFKILE